MLPLTTPYRLDGMPICWPLFFYDVKDSALYNDHMERCTDEFFVGKDLLVAPVLDEESRTGCVRQVYLPAGSRWYPFPLPLQSAAAGGISYRFDASLKFDLGDASHMPWLCPLYVREGGVLPMLPVEQYVGELNRQGKPCPITYSIYPGSLGQYDAYLDDGVSWSSAPADAPQFMFGDEVGIAKSLYRHVYLVHKLAPDGFTRTVTLTRLHDLYTPPEKYLFLGLLHDPAEVMSLNGGPLLGVRLGSSDMPQVQSRDALENAAVDSWWFDTATRVSYIRVTDDTTKIEVQAKYAGRVPWI